MSTYLGYLRPTATFRARMEERAIGGDKSNDPGFSQLLLDFPSNLPEGCTQVNTYVPIGVAAASPPMVTVIETDQPADLQLISEYYRGYMEFQWAPVNVLGPTRAERERSLEAAQGR